MRRTYVRPGQSNLSWIFILAASSWPAAAELSFDYDKAHPLDLRESGIRQEGVATLRDISYAALDGSRNKATIVSGTTSSVSRPAILFVHWYGPPAPSSNRTQFVPDAIELAKHG